MAVTSGNFAELLWPGIAELWGFNYERYPALYQKIFEMKTATKRFEKEQGATGLPLASIKDESGNIEYVDLIQGFQKEYVMVTYALGTTITREMVEDEQYNYINQVPEFLSESITQTEETIAHNILNNGFGGGTTSADGVQLFDTAHTAADGSSYSNRLATDADLSQTSIEQITQDIMDLTDERSLKLRAFPKCLVVPTQLNHRARKILESSYVTGSADNDVNPIPGLFQDLVVSPYLTDDDAWFVTTTVRNGLSFYRRRPAEIERDNEFDTQNLKIITTTRFDVDVTDARGCFGTSGA